MGTGILLPIQLSCKTVYVTFFECANQRQLGLDWKLPPAKDHFQKPVWMSATFLECKRVEKYRHRTSVPADTSESGLGTFTLLKLTQLLGISRELVQTRDIFCKYGKPVRHKPSPAKKRESLPEFLFSAFLLYSFSSNPKVPCEL